MALVFKWLFRCVLTLVIFAFLAGYLAYYLGSRSLPDYDMSYTVDSQSTQLSGEIEIARDTADVPHIFAQNDEDAYFGLGFAHAQDRLFQMTLMRRTVQGKLSEVFGSQTQATDELMRRLAVYDAAEASALVQTPETMRALQAYARGVNAWIGEVNKGSMGRGAPEFFIFPADIPYWRPVDSIALLKLVALRQSDHIATEVLRARTTLILPPERVLDILPDAPDGTDAFLPDYASLFPDAKTEPHTSYLAAAEHIDFPLAGLSAAPFAGASNSWAAASGRSASGASLMANDPHLAFSAPGAWYLARLELSTGGVIGASIPGVPLIVAGRKDALAWGITAAYTDDADVFIERLNPNNPSEVMGIDGFEPMRSRASIVRIKDEPPVTLTLNWTANGPVLPSAAFDIGMITPPGHVAAVSWTALAPDDTSMSAGLALMQAKTVPQALSAAEGFVAPAFNLTLADPSDIAQKTIGRAPLRGENHQSQGRIPSPGWRSENRWLGARDYDDLPLFQSSDRGIVGNTNNKTTSEAFPKHLSFHWGDTQRIERWKGLMQNREVHTRDSFIEAQNDIVSYSARALLPLVAAELWFTGEAAPEGTPERARQRALNLLAEWNGEMNEHLPEPLLYYAWMRSVQDRLIRDELGPLARSYTHVEPLFIERVFRDVDGASIWCDVLQSAKTETCADIARLSLDDALLWVQETYGTALESLRWGDAHTAAHIHPVLGDMPFLKWIVNIRQSTSGGDNTLMRGLTSGTGLEPFTNVHGAAYRGVYDFADPNSSVFIITTGQSGHPLSRHYDDLGEFWRRGEYVPMSLDPELARAAGTGITHIIPAPVP
jgi:penicillin amidase